MIKRLLLVGALLGAMAMPAAAQLGFTVSYGKHHKKGGFRITAGFGNPTFPRRPLRRHRSHRAPRHRSHRAPHRHKRPRGRRYVTERVWVPGCRRRVYVPARYGYRYDSCGRRVRYCIAQAHYDYIEEPGRWEYQRRRIRARH